MRDKICKALLNAGFRKKQVTVLGKNYYRVTICDPNVSREVIREIVSNCGGLDDLLFLGMGRKNYLNVNRHLCNHVAHACEKLSSHDCETTSVEVAFQDLKFVISKHEFGCRIQFSQDVPKVCYCDSNSTDWSCLVLRGEAPDYATRAIQEATLDYLAYAGKKEA